MNCGLRQALHHYMASKGPATTKYCRTVERSAWRLNRLVPGVNGSSDNNDAEARNSREPRFDDGNAKPNVPGPNTSARRHPNNTARDCNMGDRQLRSKSRQQPG